MQMQKKVCYRDARPKGPEWKPGCHSRPGTHDHRVQPLVWGETHTHLFHMMMTWLTFSNTGNCVFYNTTITPTNLIFCFYLPFQLSLKQTTNCFIFLRFHMKWVTQSRNSYVEAELQAPTIEELCKRQHQEEREGRWKALGLHSWRPGYRVSSKNHGKRPKVGCPAEHRQHRGCPIRRYDWKIQTYTQQDINITGNLNKTDYGY